MCYYPTRSITIGLVGATTSAIPDVVGEIKARYFGDENYTWYAKVHDGKHWLMFVPTITVHVLEDMLCHKPGKRWYAGIDYDITQQDARWWEYLLPWRWRERMWMETFFWMAVILLFVNLFKPLI